MLHCKLCGYAFYGKPCLGKAAKYNRLYYRCLGQDGYKWPNGRICPGHPVRVDVLDEIVWDATKKLILDPNLVIQEYTNRLNNVTNKNNAEILIEKKNKEKKQYEREKERILDLYQSDVLKLSEVEERLKNIRSNISRVEQELFSLQREKESKEKTLQVVRNFEEFTSKLDKNVDDLNFENKKKLVRLTVKEIIVDTTKEEITVKHILFSDRNSCPLREGSRNKNSCL